MLENNIEIQPVGNRVLVLPEKGDGESKSGLTLSTSRSDQTPVFGKIIKTGDQVKNYKVGDVILWRRYSVDQLPLDIQGKRETVYLIDGEDILAFISSRNKNDTIKPLKAKKR